MPKRFTPEQFAASAAAGEPRSEQFFSGRPSRRVAKHSHVLTGSFARGTNARAARCALGGALPS